MKAINVWPLGELVYENDVEYIEGLIEPDPNWKFIDAAGHGHFFGTPGVPYPTLRLVFEGCDMGHDDCQGVSHYECVQCGEEINPRTRSASPRPVVTRRWYSLRVRNGALLLSYEFGPEKLVELEVALRDAAMKVLTENVVETTMTKERV